MLQSCLLELLHELDGAGVMLTVGGGYGLILKSRQVMDEGNATLLAQPPQLRSTNDLDLFLRIELLASSDKARLFEGALKRLNFAPVETARYYQFWRIFDADTGPRTVKIDLLAGPPHDPSGLRLEDSRRIKPRDKSIALHAHRTEEAIAIEDETISVSVQGHLLDGVQARGVVCVPNAFSYLLMKLYAFSDREEKGETDYAGKHAADLYQILALTTELEWEVAKRLRQKHGQNPAVKKAGEIVRERFTAADQFGIIRLREYAPFFRQVNAEELSSILTELFPSA